MKWYRIVWVLSLLFVLAIAAHAVTSVAATGVVHSVGTVNGVNYIKIQEASGYILTADCSAGGQVGYECQTATPGETAWGRATCSGGYCSWACLDVVDSCAGSTTTLALNGTVVGKDLCAGVMYMTLHVGSSDIRTRCPGDMYDDCDSVPMNSAVAAGISLHCNDSQWFYLIQ